MRRELIHSPSRVQEGSRWSVMAAERVSSEGSRAGDGRRPSELIAPWFLIGWAMKRLVPG